MVHLLQELLIRPASSCLFQNSISDGREVWDLWYANDFEKQLGRKAWFEMCCSTFSTIIGTSINLREITSIDNVSRVAGMLTFLFWRVSMK